MAETEEKIAHKGEDKGKGKENNIEDKSNDKDKGEAEFQQQKMKQNKRRWNHGIKPEMRWNQTSKDNDISTNNKFRELEEKEDRSALKRNREKDTKSSTSQTESDKAIRKGTLQEESQSSVKSQEQAEQDAVDSVKSPKIIHRDIKCDNVFVDSDGKRVTLGDFGLAVRLNEGDFVKDQQINCAPEFMAPECFEGEFNELVDVYAFGMCLLEMVTGEYPYMECSNQMQVFKKVFGDVKPASLGQVKDSGVRDIIEKCLLPVSVRPSAKELLKDPFFLYRDASSKLEAFALDVSSVTSRRFRGLHCCARVVAWTRKKCKQVRHRKVNPLNLDQ
ncbi:putative serine/threonine-protein kinase WNK1 [Capsicum chinense]|nr:putative serine/threonine-protein kinase WNK1 [Capsicum chinense]